MSLISYRSTLMPQGSDALSISRTMRSLMISRSVNVSSRTSLPISERIVVCARLTAARR